MCRRTSGSERGRKVGRRSSSLRCPITLVSGVSSLLMVVVGGLSLHDHARLTRPLPLRYGGDPARRSELLWPYIARRPVPTPNRSLALEPPVAAGPHILQRDDQSIDDYGWIDPGDAVAVERPTSPFSKSVTACKLTVMDLMESEAVERRSSGRPCPINLARNRARWRMSGSPVVTGGLKVVRKRGFEPPLGCPN